MQRRSVLEFRNLWWPFGAHLLHTKWAYLSARAAGAKFVSVRNELAQAFPTGRVTDYFEPWSDVAAEMAEGDVCNDGLAAYRNFEAGSYVHFGCSSKAETHSAALRFLYRPNRMVREFLSTYPFLSVARASPYLCIHVRWSEKTKGPRKETEFIPIEKYIAELERLSAQTGVTRLVVCADTYEAVDAVKASAKRFEVLWDADEEREHDSADGGIIARGERSNATQMRDMYLNAFANFELLLNSVAIVGNFDSCFSLAAVHHRNNMLDYNVADWTPIWSE